MIKFIRLTSTLIVLMSITISTVFTAQVRIKDLANIEKTSQTALVGYGLVVGLDGSGDRITGQKGAVFTVQAIANMLTQFGITVNENDLRTRNVAAVMITSETPVFGRVGSRFDVVVSSLGDAKSLEGGVLLMTPLRDAGGDYFAMAQGAVSISGFNIETATGEKVRQNVALVGRVPNGAILEKKVKSNNFDPTEPLRFILKAPDVTTATNFATAINTAQNNQIATALDPSLIEITYPGDVQNSWDAMQFVAGIETITVETGNKARVVINERSGTVVVGGNVVLDEVMISHGSISIHTKVTPLVSQPEAFSEGETVSTEQTTTEVNIEETGTIGVIPGTTSVSELAVALSELGVKPRDIIAIFQAIKETGALQADLVIL
ncbi:MAG: flagellar basal body P-ring protein FlgI [Candidatus Marinimicrobia bacterium]|nr:flagellar basal body P-ring protein FlgI [Candidatus Neomarinimicrobiota bacterium]